MGRRFAVIIIAAGFSKRFGSDNKLLANYYGRPLAAHALETFNVPLVDEKILVTQPNSDVAKLPEASSFRKVFNADAAHGIGTSIAVGIKAVENADFTLIALADMPKLRPMTITGLIEASKGTGKGIIVPTHNEKDGHPVLFAQRYFADLAQLKADKGGRGLINDNPNDVLRLATEDEGIHLDIDRPEDLERLDA